MTMFTCNKIIYRFWSDVGNNMETCFFQGFFMKELKVRWMENSQQKDNQWQQYGG